MIQIISSLTQHDALFWLKKLKKEFCQVANIKQTYDITDAFVKVFQGFCFENLRHGIHAQPSDSLAGWLGRGGR